MNMIRVIGGSIINEGIMFNSLGYDFMSYGYN